MIQYDLNFNVPLAWTWPKANPSLVRETYDTISETWPFPAETLSTVTPPSTVQDGIANGVKLLHCTGLSYNSKHYNGVTIAYRRVTFNKNNRMVDVAVSYCSKHDRFTKKVGAHFAMEKFRDGYTISVPVRENNSDEQMIENLRQMFWY